jgi:hypothetical protein
VLATFCQTTIQSILLYGAETWTINKHMVNILNTFHKKCARFIIGKHIKMLEDGTWNYPDSKEILDAAGLLTIEEYIQKRNNTVTAYMKSTNIFKKCINSSPSLRNNMQIVWWNSMENEENKTYKNG